MSANQAKKGKLELMLEEFTEVHGTVLMGMHKELQTIRTDVEKQVASQIAESLKLFEKANAKLSARAEKAESAVAKLEAKVTELKALLRQADEATKGLEAVLPVKPMRIRAKAEKPHAPATISLAELMKVR